MKPLRFLPVLSILISSPVFAGAMGWGDFGQGPTFQRPTEDLTAIAMGPPVEYSVTSLFVDKSGIYTIDAEFGVFDEPFDGMIFLYAGEFDPLRPLENVIAGEDDGPQPGTARMSVLLSKGVIYRAVTVAKEPPADIFAFRNTISGPGEIRLSACWLDEPEQDDEHRREISLLDGRFCVQANWTDFQGNHGDARPVMHRSDASGQFWFFTEDNWELSFKMIDGCTLNGHYWFFLSGTTNVAFNVTVYEINGGIDTPRRYTNPLGQTAKAVLDIEAFPCN